MSEFLSPESILEAAKAEWAALEARTAPLTPRDRMAIPSQPMPSQEPLARAKNMNEVALGFYAEQARVEASRGLQCKNAP